MTSLFKCRFKGRVDLFSPCDILAAPSQVNLFSASSFYLYVDGVAAMSHLETRVGYDPAADITEPDGAPNEDDISGSVLLLISGCEGKTSSIDFSCAILR